MTDWPTISSPTTLGPEQVEAAAQLVQAATLHDGFSALNEAGLLHLRHQRTGVRHVLALCRGHLAGYAQLDESASAAGVQSSVGQLMVHPAQRRHGVGAALLAELIRLSEWRLRIWAMGNTAAAQALAARHGLAAARELLIMTRSLSEPVPGAAVPDDTTIRTFVVGQDEQEWLLVNRRAFRFHPEQGQLTRADLDERVAEPWFDEAGFFVALRDARMVGFHWTKQHPDALGEVYVLGVDPDAGGRGLGKALVSRGLTHLQERGNTTVKLYVEADHVQAVGLYAGYGFTVSTRDVMYAQP